MLIRLLAAAGVIAGCIDEPVLVAPTSGGSPQARLSALGLFDGPPAAQRPVAGLVPYDVIAPLWSDGAAKQRFVWAPAPLIATDDHWTIPAGTYLVKTFGFPRDARDPAAGTQLLETRVIAFGRDGPVMATYVWNDAQDDALASGGNLELHVRWIDADGVAREQRHHVPGTSQCGSCHEDGALGGGALGIRTPELADQLSALVAAGVVDRIPTEVAPFVDPYGDAPLEARALAYLDTNCAHCHQPGGDASGTGVDWRREHARDSICRDARQSIDGRSLVIAPGDPDGSVMIARMRSRDAFLHMPRGPSHVIDQRAVTMLSAWIAALPGGCP